MKMIMDQKIYQTYQKKKYQRISLQVTLTQYGSTFKGVLSFSVRIEGNIVHY